MTAGHKTPEELEQERVAAQKQLNDLLSQMSSAPASKPKNLQQGLSAGVSHIVSGAVGAAGVAVIAPVAGLAVGTATGGLLGGVVGVAGGAVVGAVGAVAIAASSAVAGVVQIVRGVAAIPQSVTAHRSGKWWNEAENGGKWVFTDMDKEKDLYIKGVPLDDSDILGAVQQELDATNEEMRKSTKTMTTVKDMEYYECLQASSDAEPSQLKRQYYLLARKYHPDKTDDPADAEKFKDIAEAYQVLSDPALRKKYDTEGKDGLSPDKTDASGSNTHGVDPALLFSFLFGSDQFDAYVGRVSMATAASVGDSPKITHAQARLLQKRRVTRLAASLIDKIDPWVAASMAAGTNENKEESDAILKDIEAAWELEAKELTKASFGHQLVLTIGKMYHLMATMYQGSSEGGHGSVSMAQWAAKNKAAMDVKRDTQKNQMDRMRAGMDVMQLQVAHEKKKKQHDGAISVEEEKAHEAAAISIMIRVWWTSMAVDVASTLYETTNMVFFDRSVGKNVKSTDQKLLNPRYQRSMAVMRLGSILMNIPEPAPNGKDQQPVRLYEEAAFAAMLETIKRKDDAAHKNADSFTEN